MFKKNSCIHLAYVDKLVADFNGVNCLLARQELFDKTVDEKKTKYYDSKEHRRSI